jgi:hypothetical protein
VRREEVDLNSSAQIINRKVSSGLEFFADIITAVERALKRADGECFVFFVHNAPEQFNGKSRTFPRAVENETREFIAGEPRPYQLDIGAGVTWIKPKYDGLNTGDLFAAIDAGERASSLESWIRPAREVWPERGTGGVPTFPRDHLLHLVYIVREMDLAWKVEIGREFAAQRATNMTQTIFRRFRKTGRLYTAQLEFSTAVPIGGALVYLATVAEWFSNFGLEQKNRFGE